ncbi:MAG: hypothetical protein R3217_10720 [Gammaproteobacteria bacterium]|nr:hypothetical protein [Gammaproteobacteria bacterium]
MHYFDAKGRLSDEALDQLEALFKQTTGGPWKSFVEGRDHSSGSDFIKTVNADIELYGATRADQDFIAAARNAMASLIEEIREHRNAR